MFGENKQFKKNFTGASQLAVNSIFSTIQGEGPFAGRPAIFLRMAQCNLACTFCDTEFEKQVNYTPQGLVDKIYEVFRETIGNPTLLVITGGEPLLQDLGPFITKFLARFTDWQIQIETAGTVWQESLRDFLYYGQISLVCSPKTPTVDKNINEFCYHWKYIVKEGWVSHDDGLPDMPTQPGLTKRVKLARPTSPRAQIYVQPVDEQDEHQNRRNLVWAAEIAMFYNYRLSVQLHKIIGLE
jgi:7-carboxy-7-deazaguanine synthase